MRFACFMLGFGLSACAWAQDVTSTRAPNGDDFRAIMNAAVGQSSASFYVQAVDAGEPVLAVNARRAQNPASAIKLVTTYAAMRHLGVDYRWTTRLMSTGLPDAQGVLRTPLMLQGDGDPQLVIERIGGLVAGLHESGVRRITTPMWVNRSAFAEQLHSPGEFDGEVSMPYNALPDAALLNFRALSFRFNPERRDVTMVPWIAGYDLNSSVNFVEDTCPEDGWKNSVGLSVGEQGTRVSGTYYSGCGEQSWHVHAYQFSANEYARGVFAALFQEVEHPSVGQSLDCMVKSVLQAHVSTVGNCWHKEIAWDEARVTNAPSDWAQQGAWQSIASIQSPPLSAVSRDMNFYSNNVMARQMYLSLSKAQGRATLGSSAQVVRQVMAERGLDSTGMDMGNGSGLSRATRINAAQLGQLLVAGAQMPEFVESLPRIGLEGTVRKRLLDTDMVGRGRIKTGTLNDVRAIAGYIDGKSGTRYAVVSIVQHANAQGGQAKRAHDAFMAWVGEL